MKKLFVSVKKEILVSIRDKEGLALLFLMPVVLVFIITLLQEKAFQNFLEQRVPIVLYDADIDSVGIAFREGIKENGTFQVTEVISKDTTMLQSYRDQVAEGKYQIGIFIPEGTTKNIKNRVLSLVHQQLPGNIQMDVKNLKMSSEIELFFDPITKKSFRNIVKSSLNEFVAQIEARLTLITYSKVIDVMTNQNSSVQYPDEPVISFKENIVTEISSDNGLPNTVQHNVPAWTLFAMFFVCIPLAGSIIKEREDGCMTKLKTLPVSYFTIILGKTIVYDVICFIQTVIIIVIGMYVLPLLDLPALNLGSNFFNLFLITLTCSLAATSFGILLGTLTNSHTQASTTGAISVVILAAIGGVWIPVYVMSGAMRVVSSMSPMNWGLHAYYEYFLRGGNIIDILPHISKLFIFFVFCILASVVIKRVKQQ